MINFEINNNYKLYNQFKIVVLSYKRITMAKIDKINTPETIHLNKEDVGTMSIDELFQFIYSWLPRNYSNDVNKLLPKENQLVDTTYIRQVKKEKINNPLIVNALYRHAQFHKLQLERIEEN